MSSSQAALTLLKICLSPLRGAVRHWREVPGRSGVRMGSLRHGRCRQFRAAFTLLEMMIALMITAMIVFTLYRFVSAHLATIRTSMEMGEDREALNGVIRLVQSELNDLPTLQEDVLTGKANKFHGLSNDELTWTCSAGSSLLTSTAPGQFSVTLTVQPVTEKASETELGLRRQPAPGNATTIELSRGSAGNRYDWQPLIRPMAVLEIRYYDNLSHSWTEDWVDGSRRPALVRLRMQRHADDAPLEAILSIPSAQLPH